MKHGTETLNEYEPYAKIRKTKTLEDKLQELRLQSQLHILVEKGDLEGIQNLLPLTMKTKKLAAYRGKAFLLAVSRGHLNIVQYLLINCYLSPNNKGQALFNAAMSGYIDIVQSLLDIAKNDILASYKGLALTGACSNDHFNIVACILNSVENGEIENEHTGFALHIAAQKGRLDIVELLLSKRNTILRTNKVWAFQEAAKNGHANIVQYFFDNVGKDILSRDVMGALLSAIERRHTHIVDLILEKVGAELPIFYQAIVFESAVKNGHTPIVLQLLKIIVLKSSQILDANERERVNKEVTLNKEQALNVAVTQGHLNVVKDLLMEYPDLRNGALGKRLWETYEAFPFENALTQTLALYQKEAEEAQAPFPDEIVERIAHFTLLKSQAFTSETLRKRHEEGIVEMHKSFVNKL